MNAFGIVSFLIFLTFAFIAASIIRKVVLLPEKKLNIKITHRLFLSYIGLLLLAIPASIGLSVQKDTVETIEVKDVDNEIYNQEIKDLIKASNEENILNNYYSQKEVFDLSGEMLTWRSFVDHHNTFFNIYVEETEDLTSEVEVIYLYPRVVIGGIDLTTYQRDISLSFADDQLEIQSDLGQGQGYSSVEQDVIITNFTREFVISQFGDNDASNQMWSFPEHSIESPHTLWIRVPDGIDVENGESSIPFDYQLEILENN
ncbi:hypothetical protein ACM26V_02340 [Salipaludibacillus sp. HK11]|uniref:hypothetical protein n=1 Tax=Salipaludibacillus sp. HK11 TaxID=3394320 RepID=UPI0039FD3E30